MLFVRRIAQALLCAAFALLSGAAAASTPEVDRGLAWLSQQPQANGTLAAEAASVATAFQARAEVLVTLKQLATAPTALADAVVQDEDGSTEYLAREIVALAPLGRDVSATVAALITIQNADGGFGAYPGFSSNSLDTAFALLALKAAGSTNTTVIGRAVSALAALQAADGSHGMNAQPSVYVSSLALMALRAHSESLAVSAQLNATRGWLVSVQVADAYSTAVDNALAAIAIAGATSEGALFAGPQQALRNVQLADGSWGGDPFVTALALRALVATSNAPPLATTGEIRGRVVDEAAAALAEAQISVTGPQSVSGASAADGRFAVTSLAPGTYTIKVFKTGYSTVSATVSVFAGVVANLGDVQLQLGATSAGLQGTVRQGVTGEPVSGATVSIASGASATTDANGNYRISGAFAGAFSVTVSKTGFDTVAMSGTFTSGTILLYSPSLYPAGQTPNSATLKGRVVSSATQQAIAGATVKAGGFSQISDASGNFTIEGLTAGAASIEASAPGFLTRTFSATLAAGVNDVGALGLNAAMSSVTITGRVSERGTNLPVAAASVRLQGTVLAATTNVNGQYQISGVTTREFTLSVSAAGYGVSNLNVTLPQLADSVVDVVLDKAQGGGLSARRTSTNRSAYPPYSAIEIEMEVENATATPRTITFSATIFDSEGKAVLQTGPGAFAVAASGRTEVEVETHNTNQLAGNYTVLMQGVDENGAVQVEGSTSLVITSAATLSGGIELNPPIVQAGANQPVTVRADVFNYGNLPIPAGEVELTITLENPDLSYSPVGQVTTGPPMLAGAPLNRPVGGVYDAQGVLWTVNQGSDTAILRIERNATTGQATATEWLRLNQLTPPVTDPMDMAIDANGFLYIVGDTNTLLKIATTADKTVTRLSTGLFGQSGVTVDGLGAIYVSATRSPAPLYSVNPATGASTAVIQHGFAQPTGITGAPDGTLYVSNSGTHSIMKVTPDGVISTFISSGLTSPKGLEMDAQGNLLVANNGANNVLLITPQKQIRTYASNLARPITLRLNAQGHLFVGNSGLGTVPSNIAKVTSEGAAPVTFAQSLVQGPVGMAYNSAGSLFIAGNTGQVVKVDTAGSVTSLDSVQSGAHGLALGPNDEPYVTISGAGTVMRIKNGGGTDTYTGLGLSIPQGIAWNGATTLYIAEFNNRVSAVDTVSRLRTTVADSFVSGANDLYLAPNGDKYILNTDRINRISGNTGARLAGPAFDGKAFTPAPDGGFYVQEPFAVRHLTVAGALTTLRASLPFLGTGIVVDGDGTLLIADFSSRKIMRLQPVAGAPAPTVFADLSGITPFGLAAIAGDGAGGLFALMAQGQLIRIPAGGGNPSVLATVDGANRIAFDATTGTLYAKTSSAVRTLKLSEAPQHFPLASVPGSSTTGVIAIAGGQLHIGNSSLAEVVTYTLQGVEVTSLAGFVSPSGVAWDGSRIIVSDSVKTMTIVPGELPKTLVRQGARFLAYGNGTLYATRLLEVSVLPAGASAYQPYYGIENALTWGVAVRPNGVVSFDSRDDHRVITLDPNRQPIATYAGVSDPLGLAFDSTGHLFVASGTFRQLVRIEPSGQQSTVFDSFAVPTAIVFSGGFLYTAEAGRLTRYDMSGAQTTVATPPQSSGQHFPGIAAAGSTLYLIDATEHKVRKLNGDRLDTHASGVFNVQKVKHADGALYAAGFGTLSRVAGGEVRLLGGDLGQMSSLHIAHSGRIYASNTSGHLIAFEPQSFRRIDLAHLPSLTGTNSSTVRFASPDANEVLSVALGDPGTIFRLTYSPPAPAPAPGAVMTRLRAPLPAMPVGTERTTAAFGSWTPPHGGDFRFGVRHLGGVDGEAVNMLHVGAAASGAVTTSRASLPAGNSTLRIATRVVGGDFTSMSKIDPGRIAQINAPPLAGVQAFGADAQGNMYFASSWVHRVTAAGVSTPQWWLPPAGSILHYGTVPVDSAGLVYTVAGVGNRTIYGVRTTAQGTGQTAKTIEMPERIFSIVRDSQDVIWALGADAGQATGRVYRVRQDGGPQAPIANTLPIRNPYAMAIDGKDNLYVFTGFNGAANHSVRTDGILKIEKNGTMSLIVGPDIDGDPAFEYEGMAAAGDCSDNLLLIPQRWRKFGQGTAVGDIEEHVIVQLIGRTGQVGAVLDSAQIANDLRDVDQVVYDRFGANLLLRAEKWGGLGGEGFFRVPVSCGAISTDLHLVVPPGQSASGFNVAPNAIVNRPDGAQELVWNLVDVGIEGRTLSFDTTLSALTIGERRSVAAEAFLVIQNSFVPGEVKVPLAVPAIDVDGQIGLAVATDAASYPANTDVFGKLTLRNRDQQIRGGNLSVQVSDAQGVFVAQILNQAVTIENTAPLVVDATFNTQARLAGSYRMKAVLSDTATGAEIAWDVAAFDIVAEATRLISSLAADKISYEPLDQVTLQARLKNVSVNSISAATTLTLVVRNASGAEVLRQTRTISPLVPGALQDGFFQYRLAAADIGEFTAELTASDPSVSARTTSFRVRSTVDTGTGLRGSLSAPRLANRGDAVNLSVALENRGNAALQGLAITFRIVNPQTTAVVAQWTRTVDLPQGGLQTVSQAWTAGEPGTFVAAASATFGAREINLGQGVLTIGAAQPFAFTAKNNQPFATVVESETFAVAGIVVPAAISVSVGEYRIGAGGWTGVAGLVSPGDTVTVRVTTASTFDTTTTAVLAIADQSAPFTARTFHPDLTPDPFAFEPQANVPFATLRTSNTVTISGIDAAVAISIVGGEYSVNNGAWTSVEGSVTSGDTVAVRLTSAATLGTTITATLTVSNVSASFAVTTTAQDRVPDAFAFAAQNDVPLASLRTSNTVTITGINVAVPISVTGGEYSLNGGAFTIAGGMVSNGATVAVRQTSSSEFSKTTTATLTVSEFAANFAVTTEGEDRVPDAIVFAAQIDVPLRDVRTSNAVTIKGINTSVPIRIEGGEYKVNAGAFTAAPGTVVANDLVSVRQTSSSSFATQATATLTVAELTAPFAVTTKAVADVATAPTFAADARVLVLVACKLGGNDDADDDLPCVEQRRAFLESLLAGLGVSSRVVTTTDAFKVELRSGRYNTYWVSGGAKKLHGTLAEEIREAAFRGETLILDGVHDQRNKDLDEVAGVRYKGKPSHLDTVTLSGTFLPTGSFAVSGAKPIRVELTTGVRQARFNTGDPAIATNIYGYGKGLLFAFDMTGTLIAQSASALLRDTFDHSLAYVAPAVPLAFSGGAYVPLSIELANADPVAVDLDVTASLPAGFTLAAGAPPAILNGAQMLWHVNIPAGGTRTLDWAVRTPQASGSYAIPVVVKQIYGTAVVEVGSYPIAIEVKGIDTQLAKVIADLQALTLAASKDRSARDGAVAKLNEAQARIATASHEEAIARLLEAADRLDDITGVSVEAHSGAIGSVIQEVELRWWSALPVCPATPLCRS